MISRRQFIGSVVGGVLAAPVAAEAQGKRPRVGILRTLPRPPSGSDHLWDAFRQGLRELGYIEGQNIVLEERSSGGKDELLPELAAELVQLKVDVLVTGSERSTRAARQATTTVPIVFAATGDPVAFGHVASFARPGGNLTGLYPFAPEVTGGKLLELVKDVAPGVARIAILWNPPPGTDELMKPAYETWARRLAVQLQYSSVRGADDFDRVVSLALRDGAGALLVPSFPINRLHRERIVALATKNRLPTVAGFREFVEAGGLMSYGADLRDVFRRAAIYVDKILKGTKPADLPVEQATKFELLVNLKTAKALGLTIPPSVLVRADEVIQ